MGPILLKPNYITPVWSGPRVNEARGLSGDTLYGESFDVSVHDGLVNDVDGGPFDGMPLDRVIAENKAAIMGELNHDGIVQIITMDAGENLSVQVHPDEHTPANTSPTTRRRSLGTSWTPSPVPRSFAARRPTTSMRCATRRRMTVWATATEGASP